MLLTEQQIVQFFVLRVIVLCVGGRRADHDPGTERQAQELKYGWSRLHGDHSKWGAQQSGRFEQL